MCELLNADVVRSHSSVPTPDYTLIIYTAGKQSFKIRPSPPRARSTHAFPSAPVHRNAEGNLPKSVTFARRSTAIVHDCFFYGVHGDVHCIFNLGASPGTQHNMEKIPNISFSNLVRTVRGNALAFWYNGVFRKGQKCCDFIVVYNLLKCCPSAWSRACPHGGEFRLVQYFHPLSNFGPAHRGASAGMPNHFGPSPWVILACKCDHVKPGSI